MKQKAQKLRSIIFTSATFIVLCGFLIQARYEADNYKNQLEIHYQHAFSEMVYGMNELEAALQKSLYATSPSIMCSICTDVFGKAMMTQMSLGELPFSEYQLERTTSFITKVGDYAYLLSRKSANGTGYTEDEYTNLQKLSEIAGQLSRSLLDVETDLSEGLITIRELKDEGQKLDESEKDVVPSSLGESFKLIESEFPEVPELIYDGPFSGHIANRIPKQLEGLDEIDEKSARTAAAEFLDIDISELKLDNESSGDIPRYCFVNSSEKAEITVSVTKTGGKIINMRIMRDIGEALIDQQEAIDKAKEFLEQHGITSMKESYSMKNDGTVVINFAFMNEGIICYPDLIKVSVALDDGEIVGYESVGYLMSHTERGVAEAKVSHDSALQQIPASLTVLDHSMAVIPTSGENEVFCHEFKCENSEGKHYIIYVNAETGDEEKILILLEDENGTLTI